MIIYVSGPMTGKPDFNYPVFDRVAQRLTEVGYTVLNPTRHHHRDREWADYMRLALADLSDADGVCILPGWRDSRGASLEVHVARELGMPVHYLTDWKARAR